MDSKTFEVSGEKVLAIKWQNDEEKPSIRLMAKVSFVYAESELGFESEVKRDNCWDNMLTKHAEDFVDMALSATGQ